MLAQLESRQEAILARLGQLKAEVEKLAGSTLPSVALSFKSASHGQETLVITAFKAHSSLRPFSHSTKHFSFKSPLTCVKAKRP